MSNKSIVQSFLPVIDKWLNFQAYYREIPSVSVGIYLEDEVIFKKSYGYANLKNKQVATPQTMYRIASHSKLFTATIIMKLYEKDLLSIDDKISKYLSWLPQGTKNIRIRHLLTHSSGLTRDTQFGQWFHHHFPDKEEFIQAVKQESKIFEPDILFKYSNIAFTLLGLIIESVSGKSFQQNIDELTKELGMNNTIYDYSTEFANNHATGYSRKLPHEERREFEQVPANVMSSATGLSSSVEDLLTFYQGHFLSNNLIFSDPIKRDMQQIHFIDPEKEITWGLGFSKIKLADFQFNGHGGGYPGFITRSGFDQGKKLIIVVLTNAIDGPALDLFSGIANFIQFAIEHKENLGSNSKFTIPEEFSTYYQNNWRIIYLQKVKNVLLVVNPLIPIIKQSIGILEQKAENQFILPSISGFDNAGEKLDLERSNGKYIVKQAGEDLQVFKFTF